MTTNKTILLDTRKFGFLLGAAITTDSTESRRRKHPAMKKIQALRTKLALSYMSDEPYLSVSEDDLMEIVAHTPRRPDNPRTLGECRDMLAEGVLAPDSEEALRPFSNPANLRSELSAAEDRAIEAHLASERADSPLYPAMVAWDTHDVVLETNERVYALVHWRDAAGMLEESAGRKSPAKADRR